jgi:hypothetical protein
MTMGYLLHEYGSYTTTEALGFNPACQETVNGWLA